jgi:hypothetical protein
LDAPVRVGDAPKQLMETTPRASAGSSQWKQDGFSTVTTE